MQKILEQLWNQFLEIAADRLLKKNLSTLQIGGTRLKGEIFFIYTAGQILVDYYVEFIT